MKVAAALRYYAIVAAMFWFCMAINNSSLANDAAKGTREYKQCTGGGMSTKKSRDENIKSRESNSKESSDNEKSGHWTVEEMNEAQPYPLPEIDDKEKKGKEKEKKTRK